MIDEGEDRNLWCGGRWVLKKRQNERRDGNGVRILRQFASSDYDMVDEGV